MIFSLKSARRAFSLPKLLNLLFCAGLLLMPLNSGCSGKKAPKQTKGSSKKSAAKSSKKAKAKTKEPEIPAAFVHLNSYEGIPLGVPFEAGKTEVLVKIDPARSARIYSTERLPEGKIFIDAVTLRIIRIETKKQYGSEQEASDAFEKRKISLEKSIGLPPFRNQKGVSFTEMTSSGKGRSIQLIYSGRTVQEIVATQGKRNFLVPAGKPIQGLFGLVLGKPIPKDRIDNNGMVHFLPDEPFDEFTDYTYFNDESLNVQAITAKSAPERTFSLEEALTIARRLEDTFAMKMSYEGESAVSGVFRYLREGRIVELRWKDGKLTLSVRVSLPGKRKIDDPA